MTSARPQHPLAPRGASRREFLAGLGAACVASAVPAADDTPAGFPGSAFREDFQNWSHEQSFANLLTFAPSSPEDLAAAANWAAAHGYTLRPRGAMHGWSPLGLSFSTTRETPVLMADTKPYLNRMEMVAGPVSAVRVETGATMDALLTFLEERGLGMTSVASVGDITVGGALAVNAHGAAVPTLGESRLPGQTFGSLSNRILSLNAVVWNDRQRQYVARRFDRRNPEIGALLTHLGRAFVTEVTLAVEPNQNLRCVSRVDVPASELFASPGRSCRTMASFLDESGRLEVIWYPFTENPWLKVWSPSARKPLLSRATSQPYNYVFTDRLPPSVVNLAQRLVTGHPEAAPEFGQLSYAATAAGLVATASADLWGPSKNLLLYVRPSTLRAHMSGLAVLTSAANVQRVTADYVAKYLALVAAYRAQGRYPVNMPVEIRVTGLDRPEDTGISGARAPLLSTPSPVASRPDWDTMVWLSALTLPGTPDMYAFFRDLERWALGRYAGSDSLLRPEWSKGWAYTAGAAWSDTNVLGTSIPQAFGAGWNAATAQLRALDPKGIYENEFLSGLMG